MIKKLIVAIIFLSFYNGFSQTDTVEVVVPRYGDLWSRTNNVGLDISEMAFSNWSSGGYNTIAALLKGDFYRRYKDAYYAWKTNVTIRLGANAQEGRVVQKTDDELRLNSTYGFRSDSTSNWYYSAKVEFNTQFAPGYNYPDTENVISKFMAPGYVFVGVGSEYSSPDESLNLYISPVTLKSTFVLDQDLANRGSFGVRAAEKDEDGNIIREGQRVRAEFGFLFTSTFTKEIFEDIKMNNRLSLYSDYLNNFGNIDVDWQLEFQMSVNKYVKTTLGAHIRYDDDTKFSTKTLENGEEIAYGARIQLKQLLAVGLQYEF